MRRAGVLLLVGGIVMALLFTSCATVFVKREVPRPLCLMGGEGSIVITVDALKERDLLSVLFDGVDELGARSRRISLEMQGGDDSYPLDPSALSMWGFLEGDFPSFLVNTVLMYVPTFSRHEVEGGPTWFSQKDGPLSLRAVKKDAILLTDGDYETAYRRYKEGPLLLDEETTRLLEGASIGIYALRPKSFFDLGLDLPQSAFAQAETVVLLLENGGEGAYSADAVITMQSEKSASTLSQLVRSGYIAQLRKEGRTVNIAALREMFLIEGDRVMIKGMELPAQQLAELKRSLIGII